MSAASAWAAGAIRETICGWRLAATQNNQTVEDIARLVNPVVRGWVEVIYFYEECGFDFGVSVDHVILAYRPDADKTLYGEDPVDETWVQRQQVTLKFAAEFLNAQARRRCQFTPLGVAQGWSPRSYARPVKEL